MVLVRVADDLLPGHRPLCAELLRDAVGCLLENFRLDRGLDLDPLPGPPVASEILGFSRLLGDGWFDMLASSCSLASLFSTSPYRRRSLSVGR